MLWVWGFGGYGQLGLGDRDDRMVPTRLGAWEVFGLSLVRMAACGGLHTLVATEEGVVWAFGRGEHGRLGLNNKDDRLVPTRVDPQRFGGAQVATVAGGAYHSAAVTEGGALFTWGKGKTDSCHPRSFGTRDHGARKGQRDCLASLDPMASWVRWGKDSSSACLPPTSVAVVVVHHEWRVDTPSARVTLWNRQQLTGGESEWHGPLVSHVSVA